MMKKCIRKSVIAVLLMALTASLLAGCGASGSKQKKVKLLAVKGNVIKEGTTASDHPYKLYDDGILVISKGEETNQMPVWELMKSGDESENREKVTTVIVESGIQCLDSLFAYYYPNLESVYLPDTLIELRGDCFAGCKKLKNIQIPDSVEMIRGDTFSGCTSLEHIDLPKGLDHLSGGVFSYCESLKEFELPTNEDVNDVEPCMFMGCTNLEKVVIPDVPDTLCDIGHQAFQDCTSLREISLPKELNNIGEEAFAGCTSLEKFPYKGEEMNLIGIGAFAGCTALKEFVIPDGVRDLEWRTFENCSALEKIAIPASIEYIHFGAFAGCEKLKDVYYEGSEEDWNNNITFDLFETFEDYDLHPTMHFAK